jgi:hypothetical protein
MPALPSAISITGSTTNCTGAGCSSYTSGSPFTLVIDVTNLTLGSFTLSGLSDTLTVTGTLGGSDTYTFAGALNGGLAGISGSWLSWTGGTTFSNGTTNPVITYGAATTLAAINTTLASDLGLGATATTAVISGITGGATILTAPQVFSDTFGANLSAAPEPASFLMFGGGLLLAGLISKKARRNTATLQD